MRLFVFVILASICFSGFSQDVVVSKNGKKGDLAFSWGYNRSFYNKSDIQFQGDGYSFWLNDVRASDAPAPYNTKVYFGLRNFSIPQFKASLAYSISDRWSLSFNWDHMKYKIIEDQWADIDGFIDSSLSNVFGGIYEDDELIQVDPKFLTMEHSNGFNLARVGVEYRSPLWMSKNGKHEVLLIPGAYISAAIPWTDYTFLGNRYKNWLTFSGYGFSVALAARYEFLNHFFFQVHSQYGWTNLTNINLEDHNKARGRQEIVFIERSFALGVYIHSFRK